MRLKDVLEVFRLPQVSINLMMDKTAGNDPFYAKVVRSFYREATSSHKKFPLVRKYEHGYALCEMPESFDAYFMRIEASARRNYKKALRLGYQMKQIDPNLHLDDIRDIFTSTPVRQGKLLPEDIREPQLQPITNPPSRTNIHDYPYYGVIKNGKVYAFAACMVAGEMCNLNDIYGHARHQSDGIVPLLIIEIARGLLKSYPAVKYYSYGTYFGASGSMRRFKKKFLFEPHNVTWVLGETG